MSDDKRSDPADDETGSSANGHSDGRFSGRRLLFYACVAALASLLVFCIFTPRLAIWRGLDVPEARHNPEVNRAVATLRQVDDPFLENTELGLTNLGLAWRLFFPVVAHYMHFPDGLFLALPHIGCLITLGLVASFAWRETRNRWQSFLITVLAAALPWFFVSTGWLTYVDSWWVLGLLIVGLVPSRVALVAACLITPWIDERFVIALPLSVVVRSIYVYRPGPQDFRTWLRDVVLVVLPTLPYVVIRLVAMLGQDATAEHFSREWQRIEAATPLRFAQGIWSGYRAAWIFVIAFVALAWVRRPRLTLTLVIPGVLLTIAAALGIAADMSRGLMMLFPVMLAGCLLLLRDRPRFGRVALYTAVAANLLLPASHVLWYFETPIPIGNLYSELKRLENPPQEVNARYHLSIGIRYSDEGETDKALHYFDNAVKLDLSLPDARVYRGLISLQRSNLSAARSDIEKAIEIAPDFADGHFAHGVLNLRTGSREAAIDDLRRALEVGGESWLRRAECQRQLDSL